MIITFFVGIILIGIGIILFFLVRNTRAFLYVQKDFFRMCPSLHNKLFNNKIDETDRNTSEALLLFHRNLYCMCNNFTDNDENETIAEELKLILEKGDRKFLNWAYKGIKLVEDGEIGKPKVGLLEVKKLCPASEVRDSS